MENVSKSLLIAGAILVCILIIAVGMSVLNEGNAAVNDSISALSTQEIDAHNLKYTIYEGEQLGSQVKSLIGILISNASKNKDDISRVPAVLLQTVDSEMDSELPVNGDISNYSALLGDIRSNIDTKHKYWVEMSYQDNGLIDYINISYNKDDIIEPKSRK